MNPLNPLLRFCAALAICTALLAGGCATHYEVKVDAVSQPQAREVTSYKIKTKTPSSESDTLRAQEAAVFVKTALSGRGLYEAADTETADMIVVVDYGI